MAAVYISVYGVQAQWDVSGNDMISNQSNLKFYNQDDNKIYFGNTTNSFLQYYKNYDQESGNPATYGLKFNLNNITRYSITDDLNGQMTNLEPTSNGIVNIGLAGNSGAQLKVNGSVYFPDNTFLNSANFLTSITGNSNRIGTILMQTSTLSSGLNATNAQILLSNNSIAGLSSGLNATNAQMAASWQTKSTGLYYCGNTSICGNTDINGGTIRLGGPMPNPVIYRHCFNYSYNDNGTIRTGFATCQENTNPNFTMSGLFLASRTVLSQQPFATISNNSTGITLAHNINNPVIITPQGSIKFRDNSEIGPGSSLFTDVAELKTKTSNFYQIFIGTRTFLGIGIEQPRAQLHINGIFRASSVRIDNLTGTGTRMLVANVNGIVTSQAIPVIPTNPWQNTTANIINSGLNAIIVPNITVNNLVGSGNRMLLTDAQGKVSGGVDFAEFQTANNTRINTLETKTTDSLNAIKNRNKIVFGGNSGESIERFSNEIILKTNSQERLKIENGGDVRISGKLFVGGSEVKSDMAWNTNDALLKERTVVQSPNKPTTGYVRAMFSNNLNYNKTTSKYELLGGSSYNDFAAIQMKNGGSIEFYNRYFDASKSDFTPTELENFRRLTIATDGNIGVGMAATKQPTAPFQIYPKNTTDRTTYFKIGENYENNIGSTHLEMA